MKFDVVIGNPPYQDSTKNNASTSKFWNLFVKKCLPLCETNGALFFVVPADWLKVGYKEFDYIADTLIEGNVLTTDECKQHFPGVGSTFSYIHLSPSKISKNSVIVSKGHRISVDLHKFTTLPKDGNQHSISIFSKILDTEKWNFIGGTQKKAVTGKGNYRFYFGCDDKYKTTCVEKSAVYESWKVLVPELQVYEKSKVDNNCDTSQGVFSVLCKDKEEAESILSILQMRFYRFIADRCKFSARNNLSTMQFLPKIDLSRTWTDAELYAHFGLTQEEIDYVESTVK